MQYQNSQIKERTGLKLPCSYTKHVFEFSPENEDLFTQPLGDNKNKSTKSLESPFYKYHNNSLELFHYSQNFVIRKTFLLMGDFYCLFRINRR